MADTFSVSDKDKNVLAKDVPSPVTISKLTGNTVYSGWTSTKNDGDSILNIPDQTTVPNKPVVTLKPGDKTVNATVTLANGDGTAPLTKVTVSYKTQAGSENWTAVNVDPAKMNADINNLTDGTAYQFSAVVSNVSGDSATSDVASVTPEPPVPTAPTITATAGDGKANFTITKVDNASGYHIWSKATSDNWAAKPTQTLDANTFTGEIDGLTNGTPYTLAVSAFNDAGESDYNADGASTHVTPIAPNVAVTGVDIQPATASVDVGKTQQLALTVTPDNATNKSVTYKSSDDTVATVDDKGLVTGVKAGTATITALSVDGNKQATSAITVNAPK